MTVLPQWMDFIRTDGLAVGLVVSAVAIFIAMLRWLGTNVAKPLTAVAVNMGEAHIEFLNENTKATRDLAVGAQAINTGVNQVLSTQVVHGEKISDIHDLFVVRRFGVSQSQVKSGDERPTTQE